MVEKEIFSDENFEEAFWETALQRVNATHRVTPFSSVFSVITLFSGNLPGDMSEDNEAYGDKGNILRWKVERSFPRNFFGMCEFISLSYTYVSCNSLVSLILRNLRRISLDRIEAYAEKGNIISSKRERSFVRNLVVITDSSHRVTTQCLWSSLLTVFSWSPESNILEPIGAHYEKVNILR